MGLTWEEVEASDRQTWRQRVALCIGDAGWIKSSQALPCWTQMFKIVAQPCRPNYWYQIADICIINSTQGATWFNYFATKMLNRLNIIHCKCTTADKISSEFSSKWFFSKKDKILIKNLRQLKGCTATRFLREFRTKNWTRAQIPTILKWTVIQT